MHKGYRWHTHEEKVDRFWSLVDRKSDHECWPWMAGVDKNGYGRFWFYGADKAHRVSWKLSNKRDIPIGMHVLHNCDNPPCVNPAHLKIGTQNDNSRDMVERGRSLTGNKNPSVNHPENRPRGEKNNRTKLTDEQVVQVKKLFKEGRRISSIAREFNVWPNSIRSIVSGYTRRERVRGESLRYDLLLDGAVRRYRDTGREVCQNTAKGREEYKRRVRLMYFRQKHLCCICEKELDFNTATFEHTKPRGMGGASRDDRIVNENYAPMNGAAHLRCNSLKGSRRI